MQDRIIEIVNRIFDKMNGEKPEADQLRQMVLDEIADTSERGLELVWVEPGSVEENPLQWKIHPQDQLDVLDDLIFGEGGVGWAGAGLMNHRTLENGWPKDELGYKWLDGHARDRLAFNRKEPMPALMGEWTPDGERLILAVLDPIAAMAEALPEKQLELLNLLETSSGAVSALIQNLQDEAELEKALEDYQFGAAPPLEDNEGITGKAVMFKVFVYTDSQYEDVIQSVNQLIKMNGYDAEVAL